MEKLGGAPGLRKERASQAAELLPDGLVAVDGDGTVGSINAPAERITGLRREDVVGQAVREALPFTDREGRSYWELCAPERTLHIQTGHRERLLLLPDGREVLVTARYLRSDRRSSPAGILLGLRDAEARRRAEVDNAALISTVAHELRSPLTGVRGFSNAMLRRWDQLTDDQKRLMVETIASDADRLTRLITELLDVSRIDSGRQEVHPVSIPAREVVERHLERLRLEGATPFDVVIDPPDASVWADADALERIIVNLVENAQRHGRAPLTVTVVSRQDGSQVSVSDRGPGIPVEKRQSVFSRFWQGGRPGSTGLGLYIVKGLVDAHRGSVTIDEAPGGGARVTVHLPPEPGTTKGAGPS